MAEDNQPSTGGTSTTNGTTTSPDGGSATGSSPSDGGLAAALGDGTGAKPAADGAKSDAGGDAAPKAPNDAPKAPEKYEAWKVPEGYELDAGVAAEAEPIFKELGLTQENAQRLVDFYAKHALASEKERMDTWLATRTEWRESMKSDETLGKLTGKDGNFGPDSPLVSTINRAMDGLQNPKLVSDFKAAMDMTGAGDNPAFVRVLYALASKVTEGTSYAAGGPVKGNSSRPTAAAAMYPNLPSGS